MDEFIGIIFALFVMFSMIRGEERSLDHLIFDFRFDHKLESLDHSCSQNSTMRQSSLAVDMMDCLGVCASASWCKSGNLKTTPESNGLYKCEVFSTDEYSKQTNLISNQEYRHFRIKVCDT